MHISPRPSGWTLKISGMTQLLLMAYASIYGNNYFDSARSKPEVLWTASELILFTAIQSCTFIDTFHHSCDNASPSLSDNQPSPEGYSIKFDWTLVLSAKTPRCSDRVVRLDGRNSMAVGFV